MSLNQYHDKKSGVNNRHYDADADDDSDSGESGGQAGQIEFHDFLRSGQENRDDLLSPEEQQRKLSEHNNLNESNVKKQKDAKEHSKEVKNNKVKGVQRGLATGSGIGGDSPYREHPLSHTAQFGSGVNDNKKTSPVPNESQTQTNEEERAKPENEYKEQYKHQITAQPSFKIRPPSPI